MGYAEAMILEYNGKKKSAAAKLSINLLYSKDYSILNALAEEDDTYEVTDDSEEDENEEDTQ